MMCSPQELGLPDQVDGLLILREDAKVGQPFAEYLGRQPAMWFMIWKSRPTAPI